MSYLAMAAAGSFDFFLHYFLPLAISLAVTLVTCPFVRRQAVALNLFDRPDGGLKSHQQPIPYLGGVAMYLGWMAGLAAVWVAMEPVRAQLLWIAAGGTLLMVTGLADDIRHLSPKLRLMIQALVAGMLLYAGIGRHTSLAMLEPLRDIAGGVAVSSGLVWAISAGVCMFTIAGASNATNLIDGLDGLCAGVIAIASVGFLLVSLTISGWANQPDPSLPLRAVLCASVLGACLGFLCFNFNPASIFMGDSGSLLLGFNVAVVMVLLAEQPKFAGYASWRWLDGALIVFGFPVLDTGLAITRRWLKGKPLLIGDRSHLYDQLRDRGMSVRQTVLVCYLIGGGFTLVGATTVRLPAMLLFAVLVGVPSVAGILCRRFGFLRVDDTAKRSSATRPEH